MRELFHEITSNLRNNKLRTALTGFAVSWGIFLLICLLGAGNGLMNSFMGNISDYISQNITVEGWRTSKPYAGYKEGRVIQLDETDVTWTEGPRWEPTVGNVTRQTETTGVTFSLDGNTVAGQISGVLPEYQEQNKIKMYAGRFLNPDDLKERRKVVVLSLAQAKELSPKDPEALVGKWVGAGTVSFRVVGIYHTDESDMYRTCPIPYTTYKGIYDTSDKIGSITFTVDGPETKEEYEAFEKGYGSALRLRHDVAPDDRRGVWIDNGYTDNMEMNDAQRIIRTFLWILGLLTPRERHRGRLQHHAHRREGAHPRVRHPEGHRRLPGRNPEAHHRRERDHHGHLRLHRHVPRDDRLSDHGQDRGTADRGHRHGHRGHPDAGEPDRGPGRGPGSDHPADRGRHHRGGRPRLEGRACETH